ncbi:CpsD/CapB family tyrosine-protein kinase [Apilactobacillus timberlakei]|uniref:Exopolysaccharide biosynthesis protein n=1 Tax=Apilactobacillus timberlakei TaxID=2008380 RepID=A0ABY2YUP3_9LACO|nr:CpsD/CapB family tyrosine-protein kinase [Apilactobacillus timberlakei]TPR15792.1 exopolysaccharide biosynthesis protein [Apilactobacillus timberlakei]TPR16153.1 exopolysaccharide biosynthesis protein [Apilactobacillus timberlakei]
MFAKKKKLSNHSNKYGVRLVARDYPESSIAEQFRTLMTNISFAYYDKKMNSILVTSSDPSEGKSTVSANLAITYAKQGKNVLLIDADMRKPTVHKSFVVSNREGLSTYLSGNSYLDNVIKKTDIANLNVITSGPTPPNPAILLDNDRLSNLIDHYHGSNDLIILDVPPVNTMSDTSIIATKVDGVIINLPNGIADKKDSMQAVKQLKKVHANIIGAVMNMVPNDKHNNDYYYFYSK